MTEARLHPEPQCPDSHARGNVDVPPRLLSSRPEFEKLTGQAPRLILRAPMTFAHCTGLALAVARP